MTPPASAPVRPAPADRLIVALDVPGLAEAGTLLDRLAGVVTAYKVGSQLFTSAGPAAVELVQRRGGRVFLDLKYHDIPATAAAAVRSAAGLGAWLLTVHASGGTAMLRAVAEAATGAGADRPRVLAVTVLTSLDRRVLQTEVGVPMAVEGHVVRLAAMAVEAGCDGVVASPWEARRLRAVLGRQALIVTPGIRPGRTGGDDQVRVATPAEAVQAGADHVVVGRPVTAAPDPARAAAAIQAELAGVP